MKKLLVANRGEIAVRVLRAAAELDVETVAMYSHEDRASLHRLKADEAYAVGALGHPVRAYLDVDAIVDLAVRVGADAIHPGYGFLSESAELATTCAQAGVTFVGPGADVLRLTGDKTRARASAEEAGVPVLRASGPVTGEDQALNEAERLGYPLFVKAAAGGGGRGLRLIDDARDLPSAVATARREAQGAFGDATVYLEEAMARPRHIEVQVIGDQDGSIMHVLERDCSVQRRHQKVVEICPAPALDPEVRQRLLNDAVRFARQVNYVNAGTVEFLVGTDGRHAFIEMNPRIQVEHTVTEEVTGVDLVQAQLLIARGKTLYEIGLDSTTLHERGVAIQCRVTTEDPANGFRPDLGRITAVRDVGGAGIRVDSASVESGMEVTPYFDPLLVKLTARGPDLPAAARRARRAVSEFRVRGVKTNQAFLTALLANEDFLAGGVTTAFIDEHPELTRAGLSSNRTSRLLDFLADRTINRPHGPARTLVDPASKLPGTSASHSRLDGARQQLLEYGPEQFASRLRTQRAVAVTDTTFRDAHQSLLATRLRTRDMLAVAPHVAARLSGLLSLEMWGGATFDAALRFLHEDPWARLRELRSAIPNICFQMLLRGQNILGYGSYPTRVLESFVAEAADTGVDIFRIFDALNDVERIAPAVRAVCESGRVAEGTICYTSDLLDANERIYTLDYYLRIAEELVAAGAHVLCIKDMAGLLRASAAQVLVSALRERFDAPIHLHTHDTAGGQLATYLAAIEAGVDAVDGAMAPMSGGSSQPNLAALVAATDHTDRTTGLDIADLADLEPYWNAVRAVYEPFDIGLPSPTGRVYRHEIPGGQLSNLRQQAAALGLADQFDQVEDTYEKCAKLLGNPIKVTPTSKVVGDFALYAVSSGIDLEALAEHPDRFDLPASVLSYLTGDLGTPAGGWPEPFRSRALAPNRSEATAPTNSGEVDAAPGPERQRQLSRILFPGPTGDLEDIHASHGDVSVLPTIEFFHGLQEGRETPVDLAPGVRLFVELEAITDADDRGRRTVVMRVNGQTRFADALDRALGSDVPRTEHADPDNPHHVAAPLTGVVTTDVAVGTDVQPGDQLATIEAMKMESVVSARTAGTVNRIVTQSGTNVETGDLLIELA